MVIIKCLKFYSFSKRVKWVELGLASGYVVARTCNFKPQAVNYCVTVLHVRSENLNSSYS